MPPFGMRASPPRLGQRLGAIQDRTQPELVVMAVGIEQLANLRHRLEHVGRFVERQLLGRREAWGCILARVLTDPISYFLFFWTPKYFQQERGFDLAAGLKRHPVYSTIAILGTTAHPGCLARQHCLAAGCDDFISKPFGFAALQTRLMRLVYGEHSNKTARELFQEIKANPTRRRFGPSCQASPRSRLLPRSSCCWGSPRS